MSFKKLEKINIGDVPSNIEKLILSNNKFKNAELIQLPENLQWVDITNNFLENIDYLHKYRLYND